MFNYLDKKKLKEGIEKLTVYPYLILYYDTSKNQIVVMNGNENSKDEAAKKILSGLTRIMELNLKEIMSK